MPRKFKLSGPASRDIDAIWDYIFGQSLSLEVADKVIAGIFEAFELLGDHPQAGHVREDLTDKPLKFWGAYHYLIAYTPDESPIAIVAVIHEARDIPVLLAERCQIGKVNVKYPGSGFAPSRVAALFWISYDRSQRTWFCRQEADRAERTQTHHALHPRFRPFLGGDRTS